MFHKLQDGEFAGVAKGCSQALPGRAVRHEPMMSEAWSAGRTDDDAPLPQIVVATFPKAEVISVNERFTKAFGYSLADMADFQRAMGSLFPDVPYRRKVSKLWDAAFGGYDGRGHPRKCLITTKDLTVKEAIICGKRKFGVVHLFFLMRDRRKKPVREGSERALDMQIAELSERLRRQQRCLENTLNAMVDPHLLLEPVESGEGEVVDFLVMHSNPAARRHLGGADEPLEGRTLGEITPQDQSRTVMAWARDVLRTREPLIVNDHAHSEGFYGEETRYDIRVVAVDGMLSWTWRDVTERHNAARRILESEEKYRLIAQNSSDVIVLSGKDGRMKWVSPSVTKMLGWDIHEWIGRTRDDFSEDGGGQSKAEARSASLRDGGTMVERERLKGKDGAPHWVEVHSGPYMDAGGRFAGIVSTIRLIDSQIAAEEELQRRARTDELTRLFNRKEALDRLNHFSGKSHRTGGRLGVLFVDLDRFKAINDTHGHAAGDTVLRTIADRIRDTLRTEDDMGARVGGDEMLVVLHGLHDLADAARVAEKLRRRVEDPILVEGKEIRATVSVGVALASPEEMVDDLIARADDAMYRAKAHGRNRVVTIK